MYSAKDKFDMMCSAVMGFVLGLAISTVMFVKVLGVF